ncbi:MAG: hypothetical protein AABW49_02555 [Nanoarchaeota archaeon]
MKKRNLLILFLTMLVTAQTCNTDLSPTGSINFNPTNCIVDVGDENGQCSTSITWETTSVKEPFVEVKLSSGETFDCRASNQKVTRETGDWIGTDGKTFELYPASNCGAASPFTLLASETVYARKGLSCSLDGEAVQVEESIIGMGAKELTENYPLEEIINLLADANVKSVVMPLHWYKVEPDAPRREVHGYNWDYDVLTKNAEKFKVTVTMGRPPKWASTCYQMPYVPSDCVDSCDGIQEYCDHLIKPNRARYMLYPPDLDKWAVFVEEAARHYGSQGTGQIKAWEIWNEPNGEDFFVGTQDYYISILNRAYAAIKLGDPEAYVYGGQLAVHPYNDNDERKDFFRKIIREGKYDGIAFHVYYDDLSSGKEAIKWVRAELDDFGRQDARISISETNALVAVVNCEDYTSIDQAKLLRDTYACYATGGADEIYWFTATDLHGDNCVLDSNGDPVNAVGVLETDVGPYDTVINPTPKESYYSLKEIGDHLKP